MQRPGWQFALIVLVAAVALFTNLGGPRLWDRDEPRNAGCAAEMLARNDWVVPTFNQELRDAKPVLLYWLIMSAYSVFGVTEFAARFWSAALGFGTVLATYAIANRLFNRQVALLAAIILSTSTMFEVASRAATPDAPLIFCGTMALMIYVLGTFRPRDTAVEWTAPEPRVPGRYFPTNYLAVAAMYAAMGVGILAKGPVGLVLPTAVIGMFVLIQSLPARAGAATEPARPPSRRGRRVGAAAESARPPSRRGRRAGALGSRPRCAPAGDRLPPHTSCGPAGRCDWSRRR
jgi:4-amino-4-deoxy-L-arabinose transferase-like glycosyltransferase